MSTVIIRIALLAGLVFGVYKLYPRFKPALQPILTNPIILGAEALKPIVNKVNDILPDNIQIPVPKPRPSKTNAPEGQVDGAATSNDSSSTNSSNLTNLTNTVIESVKQKAGEAAQEQIDTVKKETGNAFCAALIETIKKQCGVP